MKRALMLGQSKVYEYWRTKGQRLTGVIPSVLDVEK